MSYVKGLEHIGIIVDDLEATARFFESLGLAAERPRVVRDGRDPAGRRRSSSLGRGL